MRKLYDRTKNVKNVCRGWYLKEIKVLKSANQAWLLRKFTLYKLSQKWAVLNFGICLIISIESIQGQNGQKDVEVVPNFIHPSLVSIFIMKRKSKLRFFLNVLGFIINTKVNVNWLVNGHLPETWNTLNVFDFVTLDFKTVKIHLFVYCLHFFIVVIRAFSLLVNCIYH